MEMQDEASVLPDAKKKRSETVYTIVYHDAEGALQLAEATNWGDMTKKSNSLPEGSTIVEVLRVTGKFKPQKKTVVHF